MWPYGFVGMAVALFVSSWWWKRRCDGVKEALARSQREKAELLERYRRIIGEAQEREVAVLNSMVEGVLLLGPEGRVRQTNRVMDALFGVEYDIRGQTVLEAFHLDGLQQVLDRVLVEGQILNHELELPGTEARSIQINATKLLDRQSRCQGIVLECRDLTRLRQLENTRREFVANVSHELRTPLSMIKGYAETLLHGAKDDPAVAERFLGTIEKHADRLSYLIEDLLALSSLESGQVVMDLQRVSLRSLVEQVLGDLHLRAEQKRVRVENRVPEDLMVNVDADRAQQVLFNLVDNALKYGKADGRVQIAAAPVEGERVEVRVIDDGPGIPSAGLQRVFERFYRVDKARSREQGGTGLGLAIVKHIVQFHGGEVWVQSEPGQGATFFFTLPAGAASLIPRPSEGGDPSAGPRSG